MKNKSIDFEITLFYFAKAFEVLKLHKSKFVFFKFFFRDLN